MGVFAELLYSCRQVDYVGWLLIGCTVSKVGPAGNLQLMRSEPAKRLHGAAGDEAQINIMSKPW